VDVLRACCSIAMHISSGGNRFQVLMTLGYKEYVFVCVDLYVLVWITVLYMGAWGYVVMVVA